MKGIRWNRNKIYVDDKFLYHVTRDIVEQNEDREPVSINECMNNIQWPK